MLKWHIYFNKLSLFKEFP